MLRVLDGESYAIHGDAGLICHLEFDGGGPHVRFVHEHRTDLLEGFRLHSCPRREAMGLFIELVSGEHGRAVGSTANNGGCASLRRQRTIGRCIRLEGQFTPRHLTVRVTWSDGRFIGDFVHVVAKGIT